MSFPYSRTQLHNILFQDVIEAKEQYILRRPDDEDLVRAIDDLVENYNEMFTKPMTSEQIQLMYPFRLLDYRKIGFNLRKEIKYYDYTKAMYVYKKEPIMALLFEGIRDELYKKN
jgi:hypothetical protein